MLPTNTPYGTYFPSSYVPYGPGGLYAPYGGGPYSGGISQQGMYEDLFRRYQNIQNIYDYNNAVNDILRRGLPQGGTDVIDYYNRNYYNQYGYGGYSGGYNQYPYSYYNSMYSPPEVTTQPIAAPNPVLPSNILIGTPPMLPQTINGVLIGPAPIQTPPPVVPLQSTYEALVSSPAVATYGTSIITQAPNQGVPVTYNSVDIFGTPMQYTVYI